MTSDAQLAQTFEEYIAPNSGSVHVILRDWEGEMKDYEMNFDSATAAVVRNELRGLELDVARLEQDGVLTGADNGAPYVDLKTLADVVGQNLDEALVEASAAQNRIRSELGMDDIAAPSDNQNVYDVNESRTWEGHANFMEGTLSAGRNHLEFMGDSYPDQDMTQFSQDLETLENAIGDVQRFGAIGSDIAGVVYSDVKPPGPGIDSQSDMDFSEYRQTPSDVDPSTGAEMKP